MAQSDSTGWGRQVDAGQVRLLVTFGEKRTKWDAPTARELGYDIVSYSPYGIVGPKGMDPQVVRTLHDAFKRRSTIPSTSRPSRSSTRSTVQVERGLCALGRRDAGRGTCDHRARGVAGQIGR